ncbi:MAG TPA: hypothetical protein VKT78_19480 [Fimbriimonadaceae bacterium]|nr:hypothetical protein [Fimbriimonadaceae bacterium]
MSATAWLVRGLTVVVCAAIGAQVGEPVKADAVATPTPLHWSSRNGYRLLLPDGWRYLNASYPSDHFTDYYVDPTDANARLVVIGSACEHCATVGLSSEIAFPSGTTGHYRLDRYRVAWSAPGTSWTPFTVWGKAPPDTYSLSGVTWGGPALGLGYLEVDLWLPVSSHHLATRILNSLTLANGVSFVVGHK